MNAYDPPEFRFRIDEEPPDVHIEEKVEKKDIRRVNRRVTLIAFLIPCLFGALIGGAYYDLRQRFGRLNSAGVQEVQNLSQALDSKFSSLSIQQAKFEDDFTNRLRALEKTTAQLTADLSKAQKTLLKSIKETRNANQQTIKNIDASKTDKKELNRAMADIEKSLAGLGRQLKTVSAEVKALDTNFTQELAVISGNVENSAIDIKNMQKKIGAASKGGVDQDYVDSRLFKQRMQQLELNNALEVIEKRLEAMEKKIGGYKPSIATPNPVTPPLKPIRPAAPGSISEQNL